MALRVLCLRYGEGLKPTIEEVFHAHLDDMPLGLFIYKNIVGVFKKHGNGTRFSIDATNYLTQASISVYVDFSNQLVRPLVPYIALTD